MIGMPTLSSTGEPRIWRLDTAQAEDIVWVSGDGFGYSLLGRHIHPIPRLAVAEYLNINYDVSAATDVSDSLASDLAAIASNSQLGFTIEANQIPIRNVGDAITDNRTSLQHAVI